MTVSSIATFAAGLSRSQQNNTTNRAADVLSSLLDTNKAQADAVAKPTEAATLQSQSSQLRQASQKIAQASTFLTTAQSGLSDISTELAQMADLAAQAAKPETTDTQRSDLNTQFQAGRQKISATLKATQSNAQAALNGGASTGATNASVADASSGDGTSFDPLSEVVLFPAKKMDILSPSGATISLDAVKVAGQIIGNQQKKIAKLQDNVEFAASSVEIATQNHEAARSSLSAADIEGLFAGGTKGAHSVVTSSTVQTKNLSGNLLQLIGE